jgi:hypothetical protein
MKLRALASLWLMAAVASCAQTAPPSQNVTPKTTAPVAVKPAVTPAKPAAMPAKPAAASVRPSAVQSQSKPAQPKVASSTPLSAGKPVPAATKDKDEAKAKAKPKTVGKATKPVPAKTVAKTKPAPARTAAKTAKPAAIKTQAVVTNATLPKAARRDPFVSPVREAAPGGSGCGIGKKCLAIDAILLRGIVRYQAGMIAVVESVGGRNVSYFLRENDPVFNGYVVKITPDSIIFRENVMDRMGRQSTRDITKKVNAPVV